MALSKYEYVKSFERDDTALLNFWIVVRISGKHFQKFTDTHAFNKPCDENLLHLMNKCALTVTDDLSDILLAYGHNDEYNFVFKRDTALYNRRRSKLQSNICSLFTSSFILYWKEFFPEFEIKYPPEFDSELFLFPENINLIDYFRWRQETCYMKNIHNIICWALIERRELPPNEVKLKLKDGLTAVQCEHLMKDLGIDFELCCEMFKKGTVLLRGKLMKKYTSRVKNDNTKKIKFIHVDIISDEFWYTVGLLSTNNLCYAWPKEISFCSKYSYLKEFQSDSIAHPNSWIVIRIDGKCFHRFSNMHAFKKPNDERSLNLMNKSAECIMKEMSDIILAYGQSDEYSFIFKKGTHLYSRSRSKLLSSVCSHFVACYVFYWKEFFPEIYIQKPPAFDARLVLYPVNENLRDYLSWRQVDCHINNLYNTVFWALVQQGHLSPAEAETKLKGTMSAEKNEMLFSQFGINYNEENEMFKKGTLLIRNELINGTEPNAEQKTEIQHFHTDIISDKFWKNTSCFL